MKQQRERVIYHADCNAYYASLEELYNPHLRSVPMAVAGDPEYRGGIILAANPLAKKCGVKTAEVIWEAKRKCPNLVLVPPRHHVYSEYCDKVNAIYEHYTEQIERFGIDESWLDVTGSLHLFGGDAERLANEIRERVHREIGITVSIGVSFNKVFAKLGSDYKKPNAVTVINRENFKQIVFPLPVSDLLYVGKKTAESLRSSGILTIGDLANEDVEFLKRKFGKHGEQLYYYANGLDNSRVSFVGVNDPLKSVGNGMTFKRDLLTADDIRTGILPLADSVARRLRKIEKKCTVISLTIKDTQLKSITRQKAIPPTYLGTDIVKIAYEILCASWRIGKPIRALTITAQNLVSPDESYMQHSLFDDENDRITASEKAEKLEKTLDNIREKFGSDSINRARILKNDLGI